MALPLMAAGQSLPAPTRHIYKCELAGKVAYSDEPCLGAKKLDIVVPRGLNKLSGKEQTGADVGVERRREKFAEAVQIVTGVPPDRFAVDVHRQRLGSYTKAECHALDQSIPRLEALEKTASRNERTTIQQDLLTSRKRFKDMRC
jgi:hypothetical protein